MNHKLMTTSLCLSLIVAFSGCDWCSCSKKSAKSENPKPAEPKAEAAQTASPKDTDVMPEVQHTQPEEAPMPKEAKMVAHPIESIPLEPKMAQPKLSDMQMPDDNMPETEMPAVEMPTAKMPEAKMPEAKL